MASALVVVERLCDLPQKQVDEWALEKVLQQVLQERAPFFRAYRDLLTRNQWLLLRGIARERGAVKVMGAGFVRKYGLGTPSSVQTALAALQEKDLVYEAEGRWWLYDVLLSRWLESA
jgi:GAF domain-containing protein